MGIDLTQLIVLWPINYCQDPRTLNAIQTTITQLYSTRRRVELCRYKRALTHALLKCV